MEKPRISELSRIFSDKAIVGNVKGKVISRRNVGKLAHLLDMPLDVFFEVKTRHRVPLTLTCYGNNIRTLCRYHTMPCIHLKVLAHCLQRGLQDGTYKMKDT